MNHQSTENCCVDIKFTLQPNKQKYLLKILLKYSSSSANDLAQLLSVDSKMIQAVISGKLFFEKEQASNLIQYFCTFIGS